MASAWITPRTTADGGKRYRVEFRLGGRGTRIRYAGSFKTKREAVRWMVLKEAEIAQGDWIDPAAGQITVGEWGKRWLDSVSPVLKPKTRASYASLLRCISPLLAPNTPAGRVD